MPSSSASTSQNSPQWKYDVFLSFRGEDTRKTFTGHLFKSLNNRGIFTFQDDKRLEYGDLIPEELMKAIKDSKVALIVFSKNYATSRWCLDELVKIMECKEKNGQTVIPIFYDVDPSHVRNQRESFADAFSQHELKYKDGCEGMKKVQGWRTALTAASNLKGYDIRDGIESENIQQIVDHISKLYKSAYFLFSSQAVGINTHLEKVESLLKKEMDDVRIVGIWGMGGIGKTTIATTIFHKYNLSGQFEAACILDDVKENAKKNGLCFLQNILLSELLGEDDNYVKSKHVGKVMIPSRLCSKKVLIVLDDIDHSDHLEYLAGDICWFGNGSRVVVTTRNKDLIKNDNAIYDVSTLPDHEAMQLFNQHAFKKEAPNELFMNLSLEVVNHAKGLPLALKVWGSLLHNKSQSRWERIVVKIKKTSNLEIVEKLKISYDGLEPEEQKIFLDIACFFRRHKKNKVMQIHKSCDFEAEYGLDILIDKSLVFISKTDTIEMHDLMQDMGRYVVKLQKDSGEPSRLWDAEEFNEMMVENTGTKAVEAIWIQFVKKLCFSKKAMKNMKRLRLLYICGIMKHDDSIEYLPNTLRWFDCCGYPWESLPETFEPKRLVYLNLRSSSLHHLWTGLKHLRSLQILDLSSSKNLMQTPDFTGIPKLENLDLGYCSNLEEVHHSLKTCKKLILLILRECESLKRFPCVNVESLESLDLVRCFSLEKFPEILGRIKPELEINMFASGMVELPSSIIQHQARLSKLDLSCMKNLVALPSSTCKLKDLVNLDMSYCSKLETLPREIGDLENLEKLVVSYCSKLKTLPEEIGDLKKLEKLDVSYCSKLESLPEEIGDLKNLEKLDASYTLISRPPSSIVRLNKLKFLTFEKTKPELGLEDGVFFVFPPVVEGLHSLETLNLSYCNIIDGGLPEDIGSLSSLEYLILEGNNIEHLPRSIAQLGLRFLNLRKCERLKEFAGVNVEFLEYLYLVGCSSLQKFPEIIGRMKQELLMVMDGSGIRELPSSIKYQTHITKLFLSNLKDLVVLPSSIGMLKSLVVLHVRFCSKLESLPEEIGDLENLERFDAKWTLISRPPSSIVRLNKLKFLTFEKTKSEVGQVLNFVFPQVNGGLCSLEKLNLSYCNIIDGGLPEDIGCLSSLKELNLSGNNFEHLPRSMVQLGALQSLDLSDCKMLKELPGMPNLENLNVSNSMDIAL